MDPSACILSPFLELIGPAKPIAVTQVNGNPTRLVTSNFVPALLLPVDIS